MEEVTLTVDLLIAAAIGHAMCFAVEDTSDDKLLIDPALLDAARRFYPEAQRLAATHPNTEV
jgi:hypothetical protein